MDYTIEQHTKDQFFFPKAVQESKKKVNEKKDDEKVDLIVVEKVENKADKARAIFNECYKMNPVPQRKDIIKRFMDEAGLTKHGAATYLQNFKTKAGLVQKKAA